MTYSYVPTTTGYNTVIIHSQPTPSGSIVYTETITPSGATSTTSSNVATSTGPSGTHYSYVTETTPSGGTE